MNSKELAVMFIGNNYGIIDVVINSKKIGEISAIENSDGFSVGREFKPEMGVNLLYPKQITETFETMIALLVKNIMLVNEFPTKIELNFDIV